MLGFEKRGPFRGGINNRPLACCCNVYFNVTPTRVTNSPAVPRRLKLPPLPKKLLLVYHASDSAASPEFHLIPVINGFRVITRSAHREGFAGIAQPPLNGDAENIAEKRNGNINKANRVGIDVHLFGIRMVYCCDRPLFITSLYERG